MRTIAIATLVIPPSCGSTRQARSMERSGFLPSDVELKQGAGEQPLWVYSNPAASLNEYDALLIDPVEVWYGESARRAGASDEDLERLSFELHDALTGALASDYRIVTAPGPGVLRLRAALTDADPSRPVGDTLTTFVPKLRRASLVGGRLLNARLWTGAASVEGELLDSLTGERLLAAMDRRIGTKSVRGVWERWDDVRSAFDSWAVRVRDRMRELRAVQPVDTRGGRTPN